MSEYQSNMQRQVAYQSGKIAKQAHKQIILRTMKKKLNLSYVNTQPLRNFASHRICFAVTGVSSSPSFAFHTAPTMPFISSCQRKQLMRLIANARRRECQGNCVVTGRLQLVANPHQRSSQSSDLSFTLFMPRLKKCNTRDVVNPGFAISQSSDKPI